ncbi:TraR/DksA C4-type zinc finger protein [Agreia sp. VKM Ac-1783]|uniref:TraR/DksA family transcriptional regulator n=1 Tax=Agreia sp. VKM Ac-1783 TaxID=1938889 RepID=UPI000A2AD0AE|nr:TraR/DksA C4-type zinc finger protein [Agreia sp. VKM Ac-1783]SMQ71340.1 transcriptional regulator, TraR/DksA family [Agreia sp. VKM Ac-1783]
MSTVQSRASESALTDAELRLLETQLRERRLDIDRELGGLAQTLVEVREARGAESVDDEHDPEGPTLSSEWSRIHGVHGELAAASEAVDAALERIADGSYGICTRCGQPIGFARLEARPEATLCIACARAAER